MNAIFAVRRQFGARPRSRDGRCRPSLQELESRLVLSPPGSGWYLARADEFNGTSLDTSLWRVDTSHRRDAQNTASALSVSGGYLTITSYTSGGTHYTGFIDTRNSFLSTYGYYEARIDYQNTPGQWSAFWMQSPTNGNPMGNPAVAGTEIDISEHRKVDSAGRDVTNKSNIAIHWDGYGTAEKSTGTLATNPTGTSLQGNFHIYGLLWTPDRYEVYIDGIHVWTGTQAVSHRSEYMLLSSEIQNASWAGNIPTGGYGSQTSSVTKTIVDWVRVWQRPLYGSDVGSVSQAGSDDTDGQGNWTAQGSGDTWSTADRFHFAYVPIAGDAEVYGLVDAESASDPAAKAGLMIRESTAANAKNVTLFLSAGGTVAFQGRAQTGGTTAQVGSGGVVGFPYVLDLLRSGDTFYAWYSGDSVNWNFLGTQTIPMAAEVDVGLFVTNHNAGGLNVAQFEFVATSGGGGGGAAPMASRASSADSEVAWVVWDTGLHHRALLLADRDWSRSGVAELPAGERGVSTP